MTSALQSYRKRRRPSTRARRLIRWTRCLICREPQPFSDQCLCPACSFIEGAGSEVIWQRKEHPDDT